MRTLLGGPACSGVRLCPESSTLDSQRTSCRLGVPQGCCRARGELGDPEAGGQKGGDTSSAPHYRLCPACCATCLLAAPAAGARGTASPNSLRSCGARSNAAWLKHVSLFCSRLPAGFSHLPNGLYPSYIPLSHLEPPSAGSPLLAQLGQHSLFESQKGERGSRLSFPLSAPQHSTSSG